MYWCLYDRNHSHHCRRHVHRGPARLLLLQVQSRTIGQASRGRDRACMTKLQDLAEEIRICLNCYTKFRNLPNSERVKVRDWYLHGPWFFPPDESGVKGFFGTGSIVFVCPRPSTGSFADTASRLFYKLLKEHGFSDAHLTDMVKCRRKAGKMSSVEIQNCLPFLIREIDILKPQRIVAVGNDVYRELKGLLENVIQICHYSYAHRYKKADRLEMQLRMLSEK